MKWRSGWETSSELSTGMVIGVREYVEIWYLLIKFSRQEGSGGVKLDCDSGMRCRCNFSEVACSLSSGVNLLNSSDSSKVRFVGEPCHLQ